MSSLPALAVALALALTGCGKLGADGSDGSAGSAGSAGSPVVAPTSSSTTSSAAATPDAATLDGISQDLGAAGTANSQADSNAQAGDQAAASGDEP